MPQARHLPFLGAVLALVFLAQTAAAADPVNVRIMALEETVGTMEVTVSAVDSAGRPLQDLTADNFRVALEEAQLNVREIRRPDASQLPAYVVLLVDASFSMDGSPIQEARTAISNFVQALEPNDQISIISFAGVVTQIQDFTSDRALLDAAISRLELAGDTALFDAVIAGSQVIAATPEGRRIVVLLSDGVATVGLENRQASLDAARAADVGIVAVGLGEEIDIGYLTELVEASDGRLLEAPTPASLSQAYSDLAYAIRSQYTLVIDVPPSIDRTVAGTLRVHATVNADFSTTERFLEPLEGALPPPFDLKLVGLTPGQELEAPISLAASPFEARQIVSVEYLVDGEIVHTAEGETLGYDFDPAGIEPGNHTLTVIATDTAGKPGRVDVPFIVPAPVVATPGPNIPILPILAVLLAALLLYMIARLINKRRKKLPTYVSDRVRPWAERSGSLPAPSEVLPEREERPSQPPEPLPEAPVGRLVVMNEGALQSGALEGIQEYELYRSPLTFGTGDTADVRVDDQTGMIAAEEARVWVQRGRLVYHKLTTLSAMATEGLTSGWQFLENGEELRIGSYRLLFQTLDEEEKAQEESEEQPLGLPQEHGMDLRRAWEAMNDMPTQAQPSISQFTDTSIESRQSNPPAGQVTDGPRHPGAAPGAETTPFPGQPESSPLAGWSSAEDEAKPAGDSLLDDSQLQWQVRQLMENAPGLDTPSGGGVPPSTTPFAGSSFGSFVSSADDEEEPPDDEAEEEWPTTDPYRKEDSPPYDSSPFQGEGDYRSA